MVHRGDLGCLAAFLGSLCGLGVLSLERYTWFSKKVFVCKNVSGACANLPVNPKAYEHACVAVHAIL